MAKTINGINFSDLSRIGLGSPFNNVINGDISTESDLQDYIDAGEEYRNIQSIFIDWNGAKPGIGEGNNGIKTTGELLSLIKSSLDSKAASTHTHTFSQFTGKPTGNQSVNLGTSVTIQQISQSTQGQVSGTDRTITINHGTTSTTLGGAKTTDLYKISIDANGHITLAQKVSYSDLVNELKSYLKPWLDDLYEPKSNIVNVTGITLNHATLSINPETSSTITATVTPSNATDKSVTWTSSNEAVAIVNSSGSVSWIKGGTATITCTSNNNPSIKATCDVTCIAKANINPIVTMSGWTYGGTATSPSVSGNTGNGSVTYKYKVSTAADSTYTTTKPSNAGTYTVQATVAETTNYNGATATVNFTIAKANINPIVTMGDWTYGGTATNPSVSGNTGSGSVTYKYKVSTAADSTYTTTKPSNAGTYTVQATVAATTNYNGATATVNFTIAKANINPIVTMGDWTEGGTASNPSVSGNTGNGSVTYKYKVSTAADNTYTTTKPSTAGTYTVQATIGATTNYNGATATTNFTISAAVVTNYYWYVGQSNPVEMTTIDPIVTDETSAGWRLIGTSLPTYNSSNKLYDSNGTIITTGTLLATQWVAIPNESSACVRDGAGNDGTTVNICTRKDNKILNGVEYKVYEWNSKAKKLGYDIY